MDEDIHQIIREMMQEHRDIEKVAHLFGVQSATIKKILNGHIPSILTLNKIRNNNPLTKCSLTFPEIEASIDLKKECQKLLNANLPLQIITKQFKTQESVIKKIACGLDVSPTIIHKIKDLIRQFNDGSLTIDYNAAHLTRLKETYQIYLTEGTLEAAGRVLKLTRERVRQRLVKGTKLGLFKYNGREYPYVSYEDIISSYRTDPKLPTTAKKLNITTSYLKKLLTAYKITSETLKDIHREQYKLRCIEEYKTVCSTLQKDATSTDLQSTSSGRYLYNKITKIWGGIDNFRNELSIPKPKREHFGEKMRPWRERKQKLAIIMRMQDLDKIRDFLKSKQVCQISEIAIQTGLKTPRVYSLLQILIACGEIEVIGNNNKRKYKLM